MLPGTFCRIRIKSSKSCLFTKFPARIGILQAQQATVLKVSSEIKETLTYTLITTQPPSHPHLLPTSFWPLGINNSSFHILKRTVLWSNIHNNM